jgi:hypothetical protein
MIQTTVKKINISIQLWHKIERTFQILIERIIKKEKNSIFIERKWKNTKCYLWTNDRKNLSKVKTLNENFIFRLNEKKETKSKENIWTKRSKETNYWKKLKIEIISVIFNCLMIEKIENWQMIVKKKFIGFTKLTSFNHLTFRWMVEVDARFLILEFIYWNCW